METVIKMVEEQGTVLSHSAIFLKIEKKCFNKAKVWPRGYKTFFMLNAAEHEILKDYYYENIKKYSIFQAQKSLECYISCS